MEPLVELRLNYIIRSVSPQENKFIVRTITSLSRTVKVLDERIPVSIPPPWLDFSTVGIAVLFNQLLLGRGDYYCPDCSCKV